MSYLATAGTYSNGIIKQGNYEIRMCHYLLKARYNLISLIKIFKKEGNLQVGYSVMGRLWLLHWFINNCDKIGGAR